MSPLPKLEPEDFKLLDWYRTVCETGSIQRAADTLCVSRATLSDGLKRLRTKLGLELLESTPAGSFPTPKGRIVLKEACRLRNEFSSSVKRIEDDTAASISYTIGSVFGAYNQLIEAADKHLNEVDLMSRAMSVKDPGRDLLDGKIDMALLLGPTRVQSQLEHRPIRMEKRVAIMRKNLLPDEWGDSVTLDQLDQFLWPKAPDDSDQFHLAPWLCCDIRPGLPPRQVSASIEPFELRDALLTQDAIVVSTHTISTLFLDDTSFTKVELNAPGWEMCLHTTKEKAAHLDDVAQAMRSR